MQIRGIIQSIEKIGDNTESCPISTSASWTPEQKEFQKYWIDLSTRYSEKKLTMQFIKPKCLRIKVSIL